MTQRLLNKHNLPSAAYAYAPDKNDPTTWRLPLWEVDKGLSKAAVTNVLSVMEETLRTIPEEDRGAVRAKIRSASKKLGISEAAPMIFDFDFEPLTEATGDGKTAQLVVIRPGFNRDKSRYYPPETLAKAVPLFEGAKMYIDHQTSKETQLRPEGSVSNWAAVLRNVRVAESGEVVGTAHIHQPALRELLVNLKESDMLKELGVSIRGFGKTVRRAVQGIRTSLVESIEKIRSVDFVTEAGAGGFVSLLESDQLLQELTIETLRNKRPDLLEDLVRETTNGEETMELEQVEEALGAVTGKVDALVETVSKLVEGMETSTKENAELNKQLLESKEIAAKAQAQKEIAEAIDASTLPKQAKNRLKEDFKESEKLDGLQEAIKREAAYISEFKGPGKPSGLGGSESLEDLKEAKESKLLLKESFKESYLIQGKTEEEAERLAESAANPR